jgi:hypothetical protein
VKYEPIPEMSVGDIEAAIDRNEPEELLVAVLSAALYGSDLGWAESVCAKLASHEHFSVRGNAILGFGHLARIHGRLDRPVALPIIEAGLGDSHEYVRGQAEAAADDVEHFLGWSIARRRVGQDRES